MMIVEMIKRARKIKMNRGFQVKRKRKRRRRKTKRKINQKLKNKLSCLKLHRFPNSNYLPKPKPIKDSDA